MGFVSKIPWYQNHELMLCCSSPLHKLSSQHHNKQRRSLSKLPRHSLRRRCNSLRSSRLNKKPSLPSRRLNHNQTKPSNNHPSSNSLNKTNPSKAHLQPRTMLINQHPMNPNIISRTIKIKVDFRR